MSNAINTAMMATTVSHRGAGAYGTLSTIIAVGGLCGALAERGVPAPACEPSGSARSVPAWPSS